MQEHKWSKSEQNGGIAAKGMTFRYSHSVVLLEYAFMISATTESRNVPQKVPANVERIEADLGLGLFSTGKQS